MLKPIDAKSWPYITTKNLFIGKENTIENYCSKYITKYMADYDMYVAKSFEIKRSTGLPEKPDYITNYQL